MRSHQVDYKGYTIYCENNLYWIATNPTTKYFSFQDCKNQVDRMERDREVINTNLSTIIQRKIHQ